jgi:hypothetical protein
MCSNEYFRSIPQVNCYVILPYTRYAGLHTSYDASGMIFSKTLAILFFLKYEDLYFSLAGKHGAGDCVCVCVYIYIYIYIYICLLL